MPVSMTSAMISALSTNAAVVARALVAQPVAGASPPGRALGVAALITWMLDAGSGGYMLVTWIRRGGPRALLAAGDRLAPALVFGHFGLASTGLLLWASYVATLVPALAWVAVTLLVVVIGLGISTVTLWTPFPAQPTVAGEGPQSGTAQPGPRADDAPEGTPAGTEADAPEGRPAGTDDDGRTDPAGHPGTSPVTDEMLARALTDDALLRRLVDDVIASVPAKPPGRRGNPADPGRRRQPRPQMAVLIPVGHGVAAMATVLLAVLATVIAR